MFLGFSGFEFFVENGEKFAFAGGGEVVVEGQVSQDVVQAVRIVALCLLTANHVVG